jgi:hypothetical protein
MKKVVIPIVIVIAIVLAIVLVIRFPFPSSISDAEETEPYEVSFDAYADRSLRSTGIWTYKPTGLVMIKNNDNVERTFKVEITHYYGDETYTKEFTLTITPEQMKSARLTSSDIISDVGSDILHGDTVQEHVRTGDWGIDYRVTPQ